MPVTLTIIADDAASLVQEFRTLNAETSPTGGPVTTFDNTPLDVLIDKVRERLRADGFKLEILDESESTSEPEVGEVEGHGHDLSKIPEPTAPAPKRGRPRKNGAAQAQPPAETITRPETMTTETTDDEDLDAMNPKPSKDAPVQDPDVSDPVSDRQFVMDTLGGLAQNAKLKTKVFAFAGRMAKQFGADKLGDLPKPYEPFTGIRRAMETEFADALPPSP